MDRSNFFSLEEFLSVNAPKKVTEMDYIHALFKLGGVPIDLMTSVIALLLPSFKVINDRVFLLEVFDYEKYQKAIEEGKSLCDIQYWLNMTEITGIFEDCSTEKCLEIGEKICAAWNMKLHNEGYHNCKAKLLQDEGEVYLTIF